MTERWRDIPGYEGFYAVSDLGRIKRLAREVRNGKGWVNLPERLLCPTTLPSGHQVVCLKQSGRQTTLSLHRSVCLAFNGKSDLPVIHVNGNRLDNRASNLRFCSLSQMAAEGRIRHVRGEAKSGAVLSEESVRLARAMLAEGASTRHVAKTLGVSAGAIQRVREGKTWKHVQ